MRATLLAAAAAAALVAASACQGPGTTCGRGRCAVGSCVQVASTFTGSAKLETDWWCVKPCKASRRCPGLCLQSPVASEIEVCAGKQVEVQYVYDGGIITDQKLSLRGYRLLSDKYDGGSMACAVGPVCKAGWFSSGELLPKISATTLDGGTVNLSTMNGTPGAAHPAAPSSASGDKFAPLGPLLPTGLPLVIHLSDKMDPLY